MNSFQLLTRDLEEVVGEKEIQAILDAGQIPKIYWGTAPTGKPHLGYFVPILKIGDFLECGAHVKILFADVHASLDNMKSDWSLVEHRCEWYEFIIKEMLKMLHIPIDKLEFVRGSSFQFSNCYTLEMYKMSALVSTEDTKDAGTEVVKQMKHPLMSNLLYPILQALDEEYLDVDIQFGGIDQRKLFMFARENMPKLGYKKRAYLMNPLVPGLGESGKMSSSEPNSKIDFDDSNKVVRKKIRGAFSVDGQSEGNCLLALMRFILFKFLRHQEKEFVVQQPEKFGGKTFVFKNAEELEEAFGKEEICSADLKSAIADLLIEFLTPLRETLQNPKVKEMIEKAYPK